jgi:uncharacterized iron-regulated protein
MRSIYVGFVTLLVTFLLFTWSANSVRAQQAKLLDSTLRQLEKDIADVRGLAFKSPVNAKIIARPKDAVQGVQGYYSIKEKTLYLYDDVKGNYERGVLIHEMVHALQDQHFGLAQVHQTTFGSDAELARAALIEGDATLTMIEVLKKEQPKAEAMLNTTLEKAKNLRNAFLYGIGAKYVKRLKDQGGWAAVNARYKFPPRTTAVILSPDAASSVDLGPGRSLGALAIIEKLADHPEAKSLAIAAVNGLLGDRIVEDSAVKSWQLAFHTNDHAQRFQQAYLAYLGTKSPGKHSVTRIGSRVAVVEAPNESALRAALDRLEGFLVIWCAKERRHLSFGELTDRLLEADLICVGEDHDSELCHRVQLRIIKALHASDARLGVGMEMFQRPYQGALDKYLRGDTTEEEMLKASEYKTRWGFHWSLYQPIADFCKKNGVPVAALNAPKELTAKISKGGIASLSDEDKRALGTVDLHVKAHRDHWYETLAKMHGKAKVSEDQKERSYQVMTTWDEYMAASAAQFQIARNIRRMVVLAGSGHIDHGFGIPRRAAARTGGKAVSVHIAPGGDAGELFATPPADYVIIAR